MSIQPAKKVVKRGRELLLLSWCFTSTETIRLIRDGQMEMGEEGHYKYTHRYTVTTKVTPALRWAAMRAVLMFQ